MNRDDVLDGSGSTVVLREDLAAICARAAAARETSATLLAAAISSAVRNQATRLAVARDRRQWRDWRGGFQELHALASMGAAREVLRVCMGCERVCFTPARVVAAGADEMWLEAPEPIRRQFRDGWRGLPLSHGICPTCVVERYPEFADEATTRGAMAAAAAAPVEAQTAAVCGEPTSAVVLEVFAEIELVAGGLAAELADAMPWLGETALLERAYETALQAVVERVSKTLSPADMRELARGLHTLARGLRGHAPRSALGPGAASADNGRAASRFRPPIRGA